MGGIGLEAHPTAYAQELDLTLIAPLSASELQGRIDAFLSELTDSLQSDGCRLIGHIKGLLDAGENGHLFFSITSFGEKARYKGELTGEIARAKLALNVVVYGVEKQSVDRAVHKGLRRHFGEGASGVRQARNAASPDNGCL